MGIRHTVARVGSCYLTKREQKELSNSLASQVLVPKVCKRFNGKSYTGRNGESTLESSDRAISREQKKVFHLSLEIRRDSARIVLQTTSFLPSNGEKGSKVGMPDLKVNVGYLTVDGFQRSTSVNLPVLAKGLDLTFAQLIERCEKFADQNRHRLNIQTKPKECWLSEKIARVIPQGQLKGCYPKYHHAK